MKNENTSHGAGLAIFSLVALTFAFISIIYFSNYLLAAIIAILSAILAAAAYIEARRANGSKRFTFITLIITIAGALFSLIWSASVSRMDEANRIKLIQEEVETDTDTADNQMKFKEMEELIEELEKDSTEDTQ